jgi:hypothetical protein
MPEVSKRQYEAQGQLRTEPGRGRGGWRFTTPAALLLLTRGPAHGYDLLARLRDVFPRSGGLPDPGAFYAADGSRRMAPGAVKPYVAPETPQGNINLTDPDSRLMKDSRGFVQGYNAQVLLRTSK